MKKIVFIVLLLINIHLIFAYDFSINIIGTRSFYNTFKASALDTANPNNQPVLFNVSIRKLGQTNISNAYVHFSLTWNGISIITPDHRSRILINGESILNSTGLLRFNNREVLKDEGGNLLGSAGLTMSDILENDNFESSILNTGLFPDGTYQFEVFLTDEANNPLAANSLPFTMTIKNANNINLVAPGVPVGTTIPKIHNNPVMFLWNSNLVAGQNPFILEIREFNQASAIDPSNIANGGNAFRTFNNLTSLLYNQSLPFIENNYYAWRVRSEVITENTSMGVHSFVESPWFVFHYAQSQNNQPNVYQELYNALSNLPVPVLTQFLAQGYYPTGLIQKNGQSITPAQAQQIINQILNSSNYTIEVID